MRFIIAMAVPICCRALGGGNGHLRDRNVGKLTPRARGGATNWSSRSPVEKAAAPNSMEMTMPKSLKYRHNGHTTSFFHMPTIFRDVDNAWDLNAATVRETVAPHPATPWAPWTFTLTYEFAITVGFTQKTLRGHVHYTPDGNEYKAGPGNFWIEGVLNCDAQTPLAIVNRFHDRNVLMEASGLANISLSAFD